MNTFSIKTEDEAATFSEMLNRHRTDLGIGGESDEKYILKIHQLCSNANLDGRLFNAIVDLELTYLFMIKDTTRAFGTWNSSFSSGKLEEGSILDDYDKFHGKMKILEGLNSFTFRCRAFWDKFMGILVLINDVENYQKYCKAKSRKAKFRKLAENWEDFPYAFQQTIVKGQLRSDRYSELTSELEHGGIYPDPYLDIFLFHIAHLDDNFRTPEAHGTGSMRKWSLSMLPMEKLRDLELVGHWNLANSMMQNLRNELLVGQYQPKKRA